MVARNYRPPMRADDRRHSAAAERNGAPILAALRRLLPPSGRALEVASGSGQHAACFAAAMPHWRWQPSDVDASEFASIEAWAAHAGATNVLPPIVVDAAAPDWAIDSRFDAIFCANLLHIAPWTTTLGLLRGAAGHLGAAAKLLVYGPFWIEGEPPAPSNLAFDADLRARQPAWGVRWLGAVDDAARDCGLALAERIAMPANNQLLRFERG